MICYHASVNRRGLSAPADAPKHFSHVYHLPRRLDGGVNSAADRRYVLGH
jgi:hypothetical protein